MDHCWIGLAVLSVMSRAEFGAIRCRFAVVLPVVQETACLGGRVCGCRFGSVLSSGIVSCTTSCKRYLGHKHTTISTYRSPSNPQLQPPLQTARTPAKHSIRPIVTVQDAQYTTKPTRHRKSLLDCEQSNTNIPCKCAARPPLQIQFIFYEETFTTGPEQAQTSFFPVTITCCLP